MAAYFTLTRKSAPEAGPVALNAIDAEICALMGQPVHERRYCLGWFDAIGYWLACSETWAQIRERHLQWRADPSEDDAGRDAYYDGLAKILDWLEAEFMVDCWGGR